MITTSEVAGGGEDLTIERSGNQYAYQLTVTALSQPEPWA
jgi:hypothetical protein